MFLIPRTIYSEGFRCKRCDNDNCLRKNFGKELNPWFPNSQKITKNTPSKKNTPKIVSYFWVDTTCANTISVSVSIVSLYQIYQTISFAIESFSFLFSLRVHAASFLIKSFSEKSWIPIRRVTLFSLLLVRRKTTCPWLWSSTATP